MNDNTVEKNSEKENDANDADEMMTPEKRKELIEKAAASLINPQPIPDDEKDDIFVNYR